MSADEVQSFPLKDQRDLVDIWEITVETVKRAARSGGRADGAVIVFGVSDERNVKENVRDDLCAHRPLMTRQLPASFSLSSKTPKKKKKNNNNKKQKKNPVSSCLQ